MISLPVVSSTTIPPTQLESPKHTKDLEDCRKTCLNVLIAFLALQSITGSTGLAVATLTLMLYTISLHIAAAAGASRQFGVLIFAILHAIPAVGIFTVTSVQLALAVKSPKVAISIIILCFLPTMVTIFQYLHITIPKDLQSEPSAGGSDSAEIPA